MTQRKSKPHGIETKLCVAGREPAKQSGFVNCPIYRGSTTVYKNISDVENKKNRYWYGTAGNPTVSNLQEAWMQLTGAKGVVVVPTGLAAITLSLLATVKAGDNVLIVDSSYSPTRLFADNVLAKMNVEVTYYDPLCSPDALRQMLRTKPHTSVLFLESPGSNTFEVQDVPGLTAVAREFGVVTIIDNTWSTPLFFDALGKGCDISVEAATKYVGGHSDMLLGLVAANEKMWDKVRAMYDLLGICPGNEDCFLALRGLRTLHLRVKAVESRAMHVAQWLSKRKEVVKILHPAFPDCPGHEFWRRDFTGSTSVFAVIIHPDYSKSDVARMVNRLRVFGIGYSWGGFDSLVMVYDCTATRTAVTFNPGGVLVRLQIGLESTEDLILDLTRAFAALKKKKTSLKKRLAAK